MAENVVSNTMIEELIKSIRNMPIFRQLVPMEAVSGWPVPIKRNGRVYVTIPFHGAQNKEKGKTILYAPFALITVDYCTKMVVEYVNTRYKNSWTEGNWKTAVGYFPHEEITKMTIREYKEQKKELMYLYDIIIKCLLEGINLDVKVDKKFSELLGILMEPSLKPFYSSISPKFFGHFLKEKE